MKNNLDKLSSNNLNKILIIQDERRFLQTTQKILYSKDDALRIYYLSKQINNIIYNSDFPTDYSKYSKT